MPLDAGRGKPTAGNTRADTPARRRPPGYFCQMQRSPEQATILDLTPAEAAGQLAEWVSANALPPYRGRQIVQRLWQRPVPQWSEATELPLSLRDKLAEEWPLPRLDLEVRQQSRDGTEKYLWRLADGETIESVLIPSGKRLTLCISSQAGCALGCTFCATGAMGYRRNLSTFEIAGQVRELALRWPDHRPGNIVFMGMGEPLLNWPAVDRALTVLNSPEGLGIGARHITVSTVGIVPEMKKLAARKEQFRLAISLHSPESTGRLGIMPIEKKYPLPQVLAAAAAFRKRITFEYVLISGVNDSEDDANRLARLARDHGALVNLLPLHPGGAPGLTPTPGSRIREFAESLQAQGVEAVIRRSRGLDIDAACGQLRTAATASRSDRAGRARQRSR